MLYVGDEYNIVGHVSRRKGPHVNLNDEFRFFLLLAAVSYVVVSVKLQVRGRDSWDTENILHLPYVKQR